MNAEARGEINQRMADVVAVADVGELESLQRAEFFFEREKIGQRLAGMKFVGERVDHGNVGRGGHFIEHALFVHARDDALHPALEVARHIGDGFAFAEARPACGREKPRGRPCSGCRLRT